jgi:leader peptidase (prepilin peptidase)/N-methyltransferase
MALFWSIMATLLGLLLGSFFNVCIYRIPEGKSIVHPPSACPKCGHQLQPLDLIPIASWFFLGGKCRYCKEPVSPRYALVELLTAITFLVIYLRYGLSMNTLALLVLMSVLIIVFFIDLDHMIIPDELVLTGLVAGALLYVYQLLAPSRGWPAFTLQGAPGTVRWFEPLLGMVSSAAILFVVALIGLIIYKNDGAMGMGDVKVFLPIGLILGWRLSLLTLFGAIMLGGISGVILLVFKLKDRKAAIPFGPFIIVSAFIMSLFGYQLLNWYLGY